MSSIVASSIPKEDTSSLKQSYQPLQLHKWDCSDISRPKKACHQEQPQTF